MFAKIEKKNCHKTLQISTNPLTRHKNIRDVLLMPELVCNRVRQRDAVVFVDAAGLVGTAHAAHISYAQRGATRARANVLSCHQDGDVVVLRIVVFLRVQCTLPPEFLEG